MLLLAVCILALSAAPGSGDPLAAAVRHRAEGGSIGAKHVVLLGASIGKAWKIEDLPARLDDDRFTFEAAAVYSPDKSEKLRELARRTDDRPDVIIIKECASFFPGDSTLMQSLIDAWASMCRAERIVPVLATVAPVVKSYPLRIFALGLARGRFSWPNRTHDAVVSFNDWIRRYARDEGIAVLDLEAALRQSEANRHLKSAFARRDGLHLNERAYRELDAIVIPTLEKLDVSSR